MNEELLKIKSSVYEVKDGNQSINYIIANKIYKVNHHDQKIYITITNDHVELYSILGKMDVLKDYLENLYTKYCSPEKQIMYYSISDDKWKIPIFRQPRKYTITNDMIAPIRYIDTFMSNKKEYESNGKVYKTGILLFGKPGTGKSTIIEIISHKYNMPIYLLNLNYDGMNDTLLLNLTSSIPRNSVIACEEIEKQIQGIKANDTISVTNAGILNSLDGVQRLNNGIIFVATCNNIDMIDDDLRIPLLRKGRIDEIYELDDLINT